MSFLRHLDHIVQIDISHDAPAEQRGRYSHSVKLRGIEENMQGMPLEKRPGFRAAKIAITEIQRQSRTEMNIVHSPANQRKRLNDKWDPKIREYPERLSENWEQYFTKERELPTSSSSSSSQWSSSTSWSGSQEWCDLERMATTELTG